MTQMRLPTLIEADLADAERVVDVTSGLGRDDLLVNSMLSQNDREVVRLRDELRDALASDLEISIEGRPITDQRISNSYFARLLNDVQAAYRATWESLDGVPSRNAESMLTVVSTAPGSFRVRLRTAEENLSILEPARSERTLRVLFDLLSGSSVERHAWAGKAAQPALRSIIRFAATLASSQGRSQMRWVPPSGGSPRFVSLSTEDARLLAADLAGVPGMEIITVEGRLSRAQDDPPRVRVTNGSTDHTADVREDDLLALVQEYLFGQVVATIAVAMTTSRTTGAPVTRSELLELRRATPD